MSVMGLLEELTGCWYIFFSCEQEGLQKNINLLDLVQKNKVK